MQINTHKYLYIYIKKNNSKIIFYIYIKEKFNIKKLKKNNKILLYK